MKSYKLEYSGKSKVQRIHFLMASFIFLAFAFSSCEDVIDVKLSNQELNLIGVEASITTQDEPQVFLYQTLRVDQDKAYPGISGATVSLSDNNSPANQITLTEDPIIKGLYIVPQDKSYLGVVGREYNLNILTGGVTIQSKDKLSRVEPIDSIVIRPSLRGDKIFLGIFTYGRETAGLGDYYKWDVFCNDTLFNKAERLAVASDEFVDGNYISGLEIFTDFHDTNKPEDRKLHLNDTIYVKQTSISEFDYYYYYQMINQNSTGSLFSVPPANIKSNFASSDNKPVLGLFTTRDVSISNKVIIDQSIEDQLKEP